MKKLIHFILLIISLQLNAQQWEWAKNIGTWTNPSSQLPLVCTNSAGDVFTGATHEPTSFNYVSEITRHTSSGILLWSKTIGNVSNQHTFLKDIAIDKHNNIYIIGYFSYHLTFADTTLDGPTSTWGVFIASLDQNGAERWIRSEERRVGKECR